jgi:hypothetical protein
MKNRGRRRLLFIGGGAALTFTSVFLLYLLVNALFNIATGPAWQEAVTAAGFASLGGGLLGLLGASLKEDGEDHDSDEHRRRGRRGTASRTG